MYCENCGWEMDDDLIKCPECGQLQEQYRVWPIIVGIILVLILSGGAWYFLNKDYSYYAPGVAVMLTVVGSFFVIILALRKK